MVDLVVVFVDGADDAGQGGVDAFAQHGDEDAAELLDGFGGAVVGVHEVFYVGFQAALGRIYEQFCIFFRLLQTRTLQRERCVVVGVFVGGISADQND